MTLYHVTVSNSHHALDEYIYVLSNASVNTETLAGNILSFWRRQRAFKQGCTSFSQLFINAWKKLTSKDILLNITFYLIFAGFFFIAILLISLVVSFILNGKILKKPFLIIHFIFTIFFHIHKKKISLLRFSDKNPNFIILLNNILHFIKLLLSERESRSTSTNIFSRNSYQRRK